MRNVLVASLLVAALSACATGGPQVAQREATAQEVPIRFAHGKIRGEQAIYRVGQDQRRGTMFRRAVFDGKGEFAVFDIVSTLGDWVMTPGPTNRWIEVFVKDDQEIEWGESGEVHGGARRTAFRTFRLRDTVRTCVGLKRSLREHLDSAPDDYSQALLVGIYCRPGRIPIPADEARQIAAALQASA